MRRCYCYYYWIPLSTCQCRHLSRASARKGGAKPGMVVQFRNWPKLSAWLSLRPCGKPRGSRAPTEVARPYDWEAGARMDAIRRISATERTYSRWMKKYSGMGAEQLMRLERLPKANERVRRTGSDLVLDKLVLRNPCETEAELHRVHRCDDGPVHSARRACLQLLRRRSRVHRGGRHRLDKGRRSQDRVYRARLALRERMRRKLQRVNAGRTTER